MLLIISTRNINNMHLEFMKYMTILSAMLICWSRFRLDDTSTSVTMCSIYILHSYFIIYIYIYIYIYKALIETYNNVLICIEPQLTDLFLLFGHCVNIVRISIRLLLSAAAVAVAAVASVVVVVSSELMKWNESNLPVDGMRNGPTWGPGGGGRRAGYCMGLMTDYLYWSVEQNQLIGRPGIVSLLSGNSY